MASTIWPLHFLAHKWLRSFENHPWVRIATKKGRISFCGGRRKAGWVTPGCLHPPDTQLGKGKEMLALILYSSSLGSLLVRLGAERWERQRGNVLHARQCQLPRAAAHISHQNSSVPSPWEAFVLTCEKSLHCFLGCVEAW